MDDLQPIVEALAKGEVYASNSAVKVYDHSYTVCENVRLLMIKQNKVKYIVVAGNGQLFDDLNGEVTEGGGKCCPLTHENRLVINKYFSYTVPTAFGTDVATIGLGDRLGLASPGHIQTIREKEIRPILAQQSIRELALTNRTMTEMIDSASFAVLQEGYKEGFGADGDHIKEESDIQYALSIGVSMITLDCSDYIHKNINDISNDKIQEEYDLLSMEMKTYFNHIYLDKTFNVNGLTITFDKITLMQNVLLYNNAIHYTSYVYDKYISKEERAIDFELSIDETATVTSSLSHFFVANELNRHKVKITSLAPRFCGEFQKGIDYIGDVNQFEMELSEHASIAKYFKYKLSIHSGSDKFKVFPIIAKHTDGIFHVKTAGTNWLEAIRVIAKTNPNLYRRMHAFALNNFSQAQKYYYVTPHLESICSLTDVNDSNLHHYMDDDAARQLFHITYGLLLTAKDGKNQSVFKDEFFNTLDDYEEVYGNSLRRHIGKHMDKLGL